MRAIDIDYFVKEWVPNHLEWDFYDMEQMYYNDEWQAELPIIEAEPIKHGHWEYIHTDKHKGLQCAVCKRYSKNLSPYCQWCGAKMEGAIINGK